MDDKEYISTLRICTAMVIAFLLFPAFCFITILFGYVWAGFVIMECIVAALSLPGFICAFIFLVVFTTGYIKNGYVKKFKPWSIAVVLLNATISTVLCYVLTLGNVKIGIESIRLGFEIYTFVLIPVVIMTALSLVILCRLNNQERKYPGK